MEVEIKVRPTILDDLRGGEEFYDPNCVSDRYIALNRTHTQGSRRGVVSLANGALTYEPLDKEVGKANGRCYAGAKINSCKEGDIFEHHGKLYVLSSMYDDQFYGRSIPGFELRSFSACADVYPIKKLIAYR